MLKNIRYALLGAAAFAGALLAAGAAKGDFTLGQNTEVLVNMMRDLSFFYVDEVDPGKLMKDAAVGMTSKLDPYTEYMPAEQMENFALLTTGKYGGIGALIRQKGDYVAIAEPYEGSPADKAGLRAGDRIVAIAGKDAKGYSTEKVSSELKGDPGTTVKIEVERFESGKREQVTIRRERIAIPPVPYYGFVGEGIGYIRHDDFSEDCSSDFRNALMALKKDGELKGLILDYRYNSGGIMDEAIKILSMFVPAGTEVLSMKGRTPEMSATYKTETSPVDVQIPVAVLVSSGSASAAEIVAGAFQDLDRGVLVGQRTFGKGLVQSTRPLGFNNYLKVTTAKYYIPSGRCVQAVDYAHRAEDGSVQSVPDSLVKEFSTANGRKVYDGGGVMPDIKVPAEYISRFPILVYSKGYIEDFVDDYLKRNPEPVDPAAFKLSDETYGEFVEFMQDKDMDYESETSAALKTLKQKAERELYYDKIKDAVSDMEKSLLEDKTGDLQLYKEQLSSLIEDDIVLRQHYRRGVIRHTLQEDKEVAAAVELLNDTQKYNVIITSQDTERK